MVAQQLTAIFLDRDGTIIEDAHYLSRPDQVKLVHGAAEAIARINAAHVPVFVVTNQSGIGRGYLMPSDYEAVKDRLDELLAGRSARIDASYHCPHAPEKGCKCRKPGIELFQRAAADHPGVDLARAAYLGDRWRDIEPGAALGGVSLLIPSRDTPPADIVRAEERARTAPSLAAAVTLLIGDGGAAA